MTSKIVPTSADVLRTIRETMDKLIVPALTSLQERSAALTIGHMLRYIERRLEIEGQLLLDEARYLRHLFTEALRFLEDKSSAADLADAIRCDIAFVRPPNVYPSMHLMAEEVAGLRQRVCDLLETLRAMSPQERGRAGDALHEKLRRYITWQIAQEAKIIEPAFRGRGARR